MGCCDVSGRTLWGVYALMLLSGVFFVRISIQASAQAFRHLLDGGDFSNTLPSTGCARCVQDFSNEALQGVNGTYVTETLMTAHERNEKLYTDDPFPRTLHDFLDAVEMQQQGFYWTKHPGDPFWTGQRRKQTDPETICIDIQGLFEHFEGFKLPEWKEECKALCTPLMRAFPWAMTVGATLLFFGLTCITCSGLPLCILLYTCCCKSKTPAPAQLIVAETASDGPPAPTAPATEDVNAPLLKKGLNK